MTRHWYDSWPGIDQDYDHVVLDPYGTPYSEESGVYWFDGFQVIGRDKNVPYALPGQNTGGIQ